VNPIQKRLQTTSGLKTVADRDCEPTALAAGHDLPSRMENWPEASAFGSGFETGSNTSQRQDLSPDVGESTGKLSIF
jgi:hypothetical protein